MEYTGFEPVASTMRMLRAPNCANTPRLNYYITKNIKMEEFFDLYLQEKMWMVELSRVRSFFVCNESNLSVESELRLCDRTLLVNDAFLF